MEDKYPKAFKEIYMILSRTSKEELYKIPKTFIDFIEKNMDMNYEPQIDFNDDFENSVLEETLAILALIYRDYLISTEERQQLIENETTQLEELKKSYNIDNLFKKQNQEKHENIKKEKYNSENIFINNNRNVTIDNAENKQELALIGINDMRWYTKIWRFIKDFFRKIK